MLLGQNIAIIGGGIGGLTAAIACAQRGAQVTVYEKAPEITEVGAGLQISPNGMCVLSALGLKEAIHGVAVRGESVVLKDYKAGKQVTRLDLTLLGDDQPYLFLHRADLIGVLEVAARDVGVEICLNTAVVSVQSGPSPTAQTSDGAMIVADLMIFADGLHSIGRQQIEVPTTPFFTKQTAWRCIVPNTVGHPVEARVYMGPGRHIVTYPLRDQSMLNIVAVKEQSDWAVEGWNHSDDPDNLRAAFADFGEEIPEMFSQIKDLKRWGLFRHPVATNWFAENTVLLGDAAHPTLPFMAQGAVMAIEDAWVLADALAQAESTSAGLAMYRLRRKSRVEKVVDTANGNARKYHLSFPPLRATAHLVMRVGGRLAPRKMMGQFDWIYRHDVTKT